MRTAMADRGAGEGEAERDVESHALAPKLADMREARVPGTREPG